MRSCRGWRTVSAGRPIRRPLPHFWEQHGGSVRAPWRKTWGKADSGSEEDRGDSTCWRREEGENTRKMAGVEAWLLRIPGCHVLRLGRYGKEGGFGCQKPETPGRCSKGGAEITASGVNAAITGVYSSGLIITLVIISLLTPERNISTERTSWVLPTVYPNALMGPSPRQTFKYLLNKLIHIKSLTCMRKLNIIWPNFNSINLF